jgi:membrane-associated phospholipid phosphatase
MAAHQVVGHVAWAAVATAAGVGIWATARLAQRTGPRVDEPVAWRRPLTVFGIAAVSLLALGLLYRLRPVAVADAHVISYLSRDRGHVLDSIMLVVTTMGDVVPSFTIAGILALVVFRRTGRAVAWLLPAVILVELLVQSAMLHAVNSYTVGRIYADLPLGGSDGIPSGSTARLLSVFVLAAMLLLPRSAKGAAVVLDIGLSLVFVEVVTRLYLGRHLLADIVGGLLLGLLLCVFFGWLMAEFDRRLTRLNVPAG